MPPRPTPAPLFLTEDEVCAALSVSRRTLAGMVGDANEAGIAVPRESA